MQSPPLRILAEGLRFPEGPIALDDGSILIVEIESRVITRIAPDGAKSTVSTTGGGPNGIAIGPGGLIYCCNNGGFAWLEEPNRLRVNGPDPNYTTGRIEVIDPATGSVRRLYDRCGNQKLNGPNDIVFDPHEGFWFSDFGKVRARDRDRGTVYWATTDGSRIVEVAFPIDGGANGIALSPDGKTLYIAETETARIWAWDIEAPGVLRKEPFPSTNGGRVLCQFPGYRRLDSMKVAASGNIIVATLVTGEITTVSPSGEILRAVKMPELAPTNVCFGGSTMQTLYITLSYTGKLAAMEWDEPGYRMPHL